MKQRALSSVDLDLIAALPLFSRLERARVEVLCRHGTVRLYDTPALVFSAGDKADSFFVVVSGTVHLLSLSPSGQQSVVAVIEAGETFAEAAMFASGRYPVNAEAQPGAALVRIDRAPLEAALRDEPDLAFRMLDALIARQHYLVAEVHRLRTQTPARRLASFLLALLESGAWAGQGRLPHAKQVIAGRIGIDPASLSRALRRLEEAGIVCRGDEVIITDPDRLRAYCGEAVPAKPQAL